MIAVLVLGFLLGLQHALEADHLAAVASLAAGKRTAKSMLRQGVVWGFGHMLTLSAFAGAVVLSGRQIDGRWADGLELAVGLVLIVLGAHLLIRLRRERIHFHVHRHGQGPAHLHAHSHAGESAEHARSSHDHDHPQGFPLRALAVGMMHGLAGSAALVALAAAALSRPLEGLAYVVLFGLGSVVGMALLTAAIALPLSFSARSLTWANRGLKGAVGLATIGLGVVVLIESGSRLAAL